VEVKPLLGIPYAFPRSHICVVVELRVGSDDEVLVHRVCYQHVHADDEYATDDHAAHVTDEGRGSRSFQFAPMKAEKYGYAKTQNPTGRMPIVRPAFPNGSPDVGESRAASATVAS